MTRRRANPEKYVERQVRSLRNLLRRQYWTDGLPLAYIYARKSYSSRAAIMCMQLPGRRYQCAICNAENKIKRGPCPKCGAKITIAIDHHALTEYVKMAERSLYDNLRRMQYR